MAVGSYVTLHGSIFIGIVMGVVGDRCAIIWGDTAEYDDGVRNHRGVFNARDLVLIGRPM